MVHHWRWHGSTRVPRWTRSTAGIGLLLACIALAGFAATASATPYDMRGEWGLEFKSKGQPPLTETGVIDQMNSGSGAFSGTFHAAIGLTTSLEGVLTGTTASITCTTNVPTIGVITFVAPSTAIETVANTLAGTGTYYVNGSELEPGEITGIRLKTYAEVQEREQKEQEQREKEEKEAKERAEKEKEVKEAEEKEAKERELKEKELAEAKEKELKEAEAREKAQKEKELKERQEREAREASEKTSPPAPTPIVTIAPPLVPVGVGTKTLTMSHTGAISLSLANPGDSPEHGHLTLTLAKGGKASSAKSGTLGEATFSIAPHGSEVVKLKLSRSARALLAHHKTVRVLVTVTTQATGQPDSTKSYTLTLHSAKAARGKH
jgi:outer membrane biosynthesis protein TonB